jgi:putative ABC transport system permease protein
MSDGPTPSPIDRAEPRPDWSAAIRARLSALSIAPAREADIVEELSQHLDDRWRELVASGHGPDEAADIARTEFSGARLTALLGSLHQARWRETPPPGPGRAVSLDSLAIDLRHAIRALVASPSFTIGALLVLALGIGATTAIFSVVDAVALRPLPFPDPDRIVALGEGTGPTGPSGGPFRGGAGLASAPKAPKAPTIGMPGAKPPDPDALARIEPQNYLDWLEQQRAFESIAAVADGNEYTLQLPGGEPQVVAGYRVTASFFDVLQAHPLLGGLFAARNEVTGNDRVVVLSHAFWQRQFGGDPSVVGRTLPLSGESYQVVGVMPAGFSYPPGAARPAEMWVPWVPTPQERVRAGGRSIYLQSIARLKPGVSLAQAQAEMSRVAGAIAAANPATNSGRGIVVRPLRDHLVGGSTRSWMLMLLTAVGLVLLIACLNVANLWLARASVQQRDAAVRAALGASRGRLVQRALLESIVVSVAGTIIGLALAWPGVRLLAAAMPESLARVATIGIDARVLAVAAAVALATGLVAGILPARQASRQVLTSVLNEISRGAGTARGPRRARHVLVVAEVALAVMLLVGATLFIGSFINVMRVDPGFRSDHVLTAQIFPRSSPGSAPPDLRPAFADIIDRARQLPGIVDAAVASPGIPLRVNLHIDALRVPGREIYDTTVSIKAVTPGYHRTLGIALERGRYFNDDDHSEGAASIILSAAAARAYFAGADPLGRTVGVVGGGSVDRRIVGIVADARQSSFEVSPHPEVYLPMAQGPIRYGYVLLRTSGDPNDALSSLRAIVSQVLPREPLRNVARLDDLVAAQTAERRLNMLIFALFGLLGLVIAAVGLFGVLAYLVSQQTRDIGIRMALGATRARVVAGVVGQAGGLVVTGLVAGALASWFLANLAGRFLFGLDSRDARAYLVAIVTLLASALAATALPARRAASVDPTEALRSE